MKKLSYVGERVSVGIDVHVRSYHVTSVVGGVVVERASMRARREELLGYLKGRFEGAEVHTAYEAGFSGFWLHRCLESAGYRSMVVHAAGIEVSSRERVKTDKRDSQKIALQLDAGRLKGVRVPSEAEEAARVLHRTRAQLAKKKRSVMVQIRMRLYQFGVELERSERVLSVKTVRGALLSGRLPTGAAFGVERLVSVWRAVVAEMRLVDRKLREQAAADPLEERYRSVPGVGALTARVLSTELGDLSQFSNERQLFSFVGLTPSERSSGEAKGRRGHITRQGSAQLRQVLVEAAWNATKNNPELKREFLRLAARVGRKRAIVAIARKLLGRMRAMLASDKNYRTQRALKRELKQELKLAA